MDAAGDLAPEGVALGRALLDETPALAEWDLACPLALRLPGMDAAGRRRVAGLLVERLVTETPLVARAEVAGPGFINLSWSDAAWVDLLEEAAEDPPEALERSLWPAPWRRAWERGGGLERMARRERPGVLPGAAFSVGAVPAGEGRRLVRQLLRHLEALRALEPSRTAAAIQRVDEMVRLFDRLYEGHPLLRWPPDGLAAACRIADGVTTALATVGGRILRRNV